MFQKYSKKHELRTSGEEIAFSAQPKVLGTAEAYFVCHIGPKFQIFLIYAFIGYPQSMTEIMYYKIISKYMVYIRIKIKLHLGFGPIVQ